MLLFEGLLMNHIMMPHISFFDLSKNRTKYFFNNFFFEENKN